MIIDELVALLGYDVRGESELRKFNQGLDAAERNARGLAAGMAKIGLAIAGAVAAMDVGRRLVGFVSDITAVNAEFESYEATLKTITGSADEAEKAMSWISDFAQTTPYDVAGVTQAFIRLRAYGLNPVDGTLRTVGDAASAMGMDLMSGVEAIADAVTGENERLKAFGVTTSVAGNKITYSWQENGKKLSKTVQKSAPEIQKALLAIFNRFQGAMDEQSKTWVGMTSNLEENWTKFLRKIGEAGYYDDIKRRMQGLLDWTERAWVDGRIQAVALAISDALVQGMRLAEHLATQAYRIGRGFYYAADGIVSLTSRLTGMSKTMAGVGLGGALIASSAFGRRALMAVARRTPLIAALLAFDDIMAGLSGDKSVVGSLEGGQEALNNLKQSFDEVYESLEQFAGALNEFFGNQMPAGADMSQFELLFEGLRAWASSEVVRGFKEMAESMREIAGAVDFLRRALENPEAMWQRFADAAVSAIDRVVAALDERLGGALSRFGLVGGGANTMAPVQVGGGAPSAPRTSPNFTPEARAYLDRLQVEEGLKNLRGNLARMDAAPQAAIGTVTNNNQRTINTTVDAPITINQRINQAVEAAQSAAQATGNSVRAAVRDAARLQASEAAAP
ncbi:tape measure protein [Afifella sp. H1R]|uniref:tape measure protein n=1 Tax=Afifella sp. H1R TaxID=2908841 RepID=UPI001F25159E|nr:tape measure protein [Afifella sp. H1R]MCF1502199.1 tape measure protein [Afifella sp. H1R]